MAKPTKLPEWASGGSANVLEPSAGEKALGWEAGKTAPAGWMNWLQELAYDWFVWVDERFSDGATADETTINNPTGGAELLRVSATNGISFMDQDLFRAYFDGTDPFIYFDSDSYLQLDVSVGDLNFRVNNVDRLTLGNNGVEFDGDANFRAEIDTSNPFLVMDTGSDQIKYDRSANEFEFQIAGAVKMQMDASRAKLAGYLEVDSTASTPTSNINELHRANLTRAQCRVAVATPSVLTGSYNVASVANTGTGVYTVTLDNAVTNGTPIVCVDDGSGVGKVAKVTELTTTTFRVSTYLSSTGAANAADFSFMLLGGS